jgi:hypothetical protein
MCRLAGPHERHHSRTSIGYPATSRRFQVEQHHLRRFACGRVAEHWTARDDLGMLHQFGLAPTAPRHRTALTPNISPRGGAAAGILLIAGARR